MQTSKSVFNLWMMAMTFSALVGCSLPESKTREDIENKASVASFNIEKADGKVLESKVENTFGLATTKIFSFTICLKDANERKTIGGHKFRIDEIGRDVATDPGGCVSWTESLEYNPIADSVYLNIKRTVTGTGIHKGSRTASLAINPWNNDEKIEPVIDLAKQNVPNIATDRNEVQNLLKGLSNKSGQLIARPLWVEDGRFTITEERITSDGKVNLNVEWRTVPTISVKKTNGDEFPRPLRRGTFDATVSIIHTYVHNGQQVRVILGRSKQDRYTMRNSSLGMNFLVPVSRLPNRGQLMLGLELNPVDAPDSIKSFQGIYLIGEYSNIKPNAFLRLHSDASKTPGFKIADYASQDVETFLKTHTASDDNIYRVPKIEVLPLKFPFGYVMQDTTTRRRITFGVEACLKNGVDNIDLRSHTFKIKGFLPDSEKDTSKRLIDERASLYNGCFQWQEEYEMNVNVCQHFIPGKVVISNEDLGMSEEISVMINVWDPMAGNIGKDKRTLGKNEKHITDCVERPRRQIKLENMAYSHSGASYEIDNALNLTFTKTYIFKLEGHSNSYGNLFAGRDDAGQRLRDGTYLLRAAITRHRDYFGGDNIYVSSVEKLVKVTKGTVNTKLSFSTTDLKGVANNNTLLVDLNPVKESDLAESTDEHGNLRPKDPNAKLSDLIDKDAMLDSPVFQGTINMHIDDGNRSLEELDNGSLSLYFVRGRGDLISNQTKLMTEIIDKGKKYIRETAAASAAKNNLVSYAHNNNLELINIHRKVQDPIREKLKILTVAGAQPSDLTKNLTLTSELLQPVLNNGKLTADMATKLCSFWFDDYFASLYAQKGSVANRGDRNIMSTYCMSQVRKDPKTFFKVDRYLRTKEIEATPTNVRGYNKGLTVSAGFSWGNTHSKAESTSHSVATKLGLSTKFFDVVSLGSDYAYQMSINQSNSISNGNSIGVNTQESMSVGYTKHPITFKQYRLCTVIRLNPDIFIDQETFWPWEGYRNLTRHLNDRLTGEEKAHAVTRGLLLCEEKDRTQPVKKEESYYIITQEGYTQLQATGDERNRQFFAALRSDNDFVRVVVGMKLNTGIPDTHGAKEDIMAKSTNVARTILQSAPPAAPNMYLMKDNEDLGNPK